MPQRFHRKPKASAMFSSLQQTLSRCDFPQPTPFELFSEHSHCLTLHSVSSSRFPFRQELLRQYGICLSRSRESDRVLESELLDSASVAFVKVVFYLRSSR